MDDASGAREIVRDEGLKAGLGAGAVPRERADQRRTERRRPRIFCAGHTRATRRISFIIIWLLMCSDAGSRSYRTAGQ